ncbi:MAG: hypothetical protein Q9210_002232 [Variospora velana]
MAPSSPPARRPLPQPVESTKRSKRRFAPEPVETTAPSNRPSQGQEQSADDAPTAHPRILPRPLESTVRSSKTQPRDTISSATPDVTPLPCRKLPQPIESNKSSSKPRKFAPQLVETTSRQRKRGDTLPAVLDTDKTEHSPDDALYLPRHLRIAKPSPLLIPPVNSPVASTNHVPQLHESNFSYSSLSQRVNLDKPDRRHSFRIPELPSIPSQTEESDESDDSTCPSLSTTPSAESDEVEYIKNKRNHDGTRAGYLLSLAAQAAEKQLREQAMAAYPNEHSHEPVDHFAIDREDSSDKEGKGVGSLSRSVTYPVPGGSGGTAPSSRRESHAGWDVTEKRKHRKSLGRQRKECEGTDQADRPERKRSAKEPAKEHHHQHQHSHHHEHHHGHHHKDQAHGNNIVGNHQKDDQMKPMHKAASPPMAGQNLRFPKCQSPRQTRLDVGSYPGAPCHLNAPKSRENSGLWTPQGSVSRQDSKSGLWMGVCALSAQKPHDSVAMIQTGLLTPAIERDDPFAAPAPTIQAQQQQQQQRLPPSPPTSVGNSNHSSCFNQVPSYEKALEDEFHDGFVTQVYNYLSLGYPALARKYDHELSKITRVPVALLRQDDAKANAKGYVGAPEGTGCELRGVQEGQCERWTALRLYVREWARQQPTMGAGTEREARVGAEDWGARARKGSWAI